MQLDFSRLNKEQKAYVEKYTAVREKLTKLQAEMADIEKRISETIEELEELRKNENKNNK